jgi:hypothetical protein
MGNDTERDEQNPGQKSNNPGNQADPKRQDPTQSGKQGYNPQDPSTKNPGQDSGTSERPDREGSEEVETRRAPDRGRDTGTRSHGEPAVAFCPEFNLVGTWPQMKTIGTGNGGHAILFFYLIRPV